MRRRGRCGVMGLAVLAAAGGAPASTSRSAALATVPDIVNRMRADAECRLQARGLRWRVDEVATVIRRSPYRCEGGAPNPKVTSQRPPAGSKVRRGSVVALVTTCWRRQCV